jgi:succinate dehydrogenase/fumarate reductase flavoprotein subunit
MKKETLLTIAVVLLLVLNGSLLAYLFGGRFMQRPPVRHTHEMIIEKLHYDEQQQRQFEILRQEQHEALKRVEMQFDRVAHEYFLLLTNDSFNSARKDLLEKAMSDLQRQKANGLFDHFQKLKDLCRDDQKKMFDQLLPELMHLIHPPREKNPPPPRRN